MNFELRKACAIAVVVAFGLSPLTTNAEPRTDGANTVPITTVIAAVAKRSGKKFVVDPRVQGDAVLLENPASLSYDDFLMLMNVHGFTAVTTGEYVRVIPEASVRQMAVPIAEGNDKYSPVEYVTRVFSVKSIPSSLLVPILRPLIPQQGHMVALPCTNNVIVVDTFANTQRLEQVIKSLDRGEPYVPEKCKQLEPAVFRPADKSSDKGANKGSDR